MDIQLNLINRSNDADNAQAVIFQKTAAAGPDDDPVAWRVFRLGPGDASPFVYPLSTEINATDPWGNDTPMVPAENGRLYSVASMPSGDMLSLAGTASSAHEIRCRNDKWKDSMTVGLYTSGKPWRQSASIAPGQTAVFAFEPTLLIGAVPDVEEGELMAPANLSGVDAGLSLPGIAKADILMNGGGPGQTSTPFRFALDNVVMA